MQALAFISSALKRFSIKYFWLPVVEIFYIHFLILKKAKTVILGDAKGCF